MTENKGKCYKIIQLIKKGLLLAKFINITNNYLKVLSLIIICFNQPVYGSLTGLITDRTLINLGKITDITIP